MPTDAELLAPTAQGDPPPAADAAPPLTSEQEEAALDALIEEQGIDLPDGTDKLVPLAAVTTVRAKLKDAKAALATATAAGEEAAGLKARIASLETDLGAARPLADAYRAAVDAQTRQPAAVVEDTAGLEELARDHDYYKIDGSPDLDRARRMQARIDSAAEKKAREQTAPIAAQQQHAASLSMFQAALVTKGAQGQQPDPAILAELWNRVDPALTATREGAQQVWIVAMGQTAAMGKGAAPAVARAPLPEPLLTERAGGRDEAVSALTEADKRAAARQGISEADYAKEVAQMPWRRK